MGRVCLGSNPNPNPNPNPDPNPDPKVWTESALDPLTDVGKPLVVQKVAADKYALVIDGIVRTEVPDGPVEGYQGQGQG